MHELSICRSILTTVLDYHQRHQGDSPIQSIQLTIGHLTHIDIPSLRFNFAVVARNTAAEHAILDINLIEGKARCETCQSEYVLENYFNCCPICQQHQKIILQGEEMIITSMEMQ